MFVLFILLNEQISLSMFAKDNIQLNKETKPNQTKPNQTKPNFVYTFFFFKFTMIRPLTQQLPGVFTVE